MTISQSQHYLHYNMQLGDNQISVKSVVVDIHANLLRLTVADP